MPELTYDLIAPLVANTEVKGSTVRVVFRCPVSGNEVVGNGSLDTRKSAGDALKQSLWSTVRYSLARMVRGALGYGVAGQLASSMTGQAVSGAQRSRKAPSRGEVEAAVVEAFTKHSNRFTWDANRGSYVSSKLFEELQTEFAVMLSKAKITSAWDRGILGRMLAEVAIADGTIGDDERNFFYGFAGEGVPSIDELAAKEPLTNAELAETSGDNREAMLALAMALACTDEHVDRAESEILARFAGGLGIGQRRFEALDGMARDFVVDQLLERVYADGQVDPSERREVAELASGLAVPVERVQRLEARCKKRKGIV